MHIKNSTTTCILISNYCFFFLFLPLVTENFSERTGNNDNNGNNNNNFKN